MAARAQASTIDNGVPLALGDLLTPYGRDRRVALRVERMPSRSRLSRGRNNGDGSWSLTRDELDDLLYFPPRDSNDRPTLVVRIIGLDSDNGATLAVIDVVPGEETVVDEAASAPQSESDLKKLRAELARTKASLRAAQSELAAARKTFEGELDERAAEARAEAQAEAATELETMRDKWQAEAKERLAKHDARAEERLARARREVSAELAKAEEAWKSDERDRLAAMEAEWRDKSERGLAEERAARAKADAALAHERAAHAKTEATLAAARKAAVSAADPKACQQSDQIIRLENTLTERDATVAELQAAVAAAQADAAREKEQAAHERKEFTVKLQQIEARIAETKASRERGDSTETKRLRSELAAAKVVISQRDSELTAARTEAADARQRADALQSALGEAEQQWKAAEALRLSEIRAAWETKSRADTERAITDLSAKLRKAELALQEARADAKLARDKRDNGETRRAADELKTLKATLEKRNQELAESLAEANRMRDAAERGPAGAVAQAKKEWEAAEAARFAEAKAEWERQSNRVFKKAQVRLEAAEVALEEARAEASASRDRRDGAEFKRLRAEFATVSAKLAECEAQLVEAQLVAGRARERTREEVEAAVAKAEEAWKANETLRASEVATRDRERGARVLAEVTARLERTEAALEQARSELETERERAAVQVAEANARAERTETLLTEASERIETMRDPANEAETRRLRNELANLQIAYTDREAELAVAQAAARRVRERSADQLRAAVLKAEDEWRQDEAKRLEAAKMDWERQARWAAEVSAEPVALGEMATTTTKRANRLLLDGALAIGLAALVMLGFTFYWQGFPAGPSNASAALPPKPVRAAAVATPQPAALSMTIGTSYARVRTAPSTSAGVVRTLKRGVEVSMLDRQGNWARVHIESRSGKAALDGWVFAAALRDAAARRP